MIVIKSRVVSRKEAEAQIKILKQKLDSAEVDRNIAENNLDEADSRAFGIKKEIDTILDQINSIELSVMLPYDLKTRGFQLSEQTEKKGDAIKRITYLEDRYGNVVWQWNGNPSLTDLFEATHSLYPVKEV